MSFKTSAQLMNKINKTNAKREIFIDYDKLSMFKLKILQLGFSLTGIYFTL